MYSGIEKIEDVLSYIEEHITEDIKCNILAQKMNLSVYEFRRIFSFVVGTPVSEYIRKRRLSLSACEIATSETIDLLSLSEKYRYSSQSAFSKAFKMYHGCAPSEYLKGQHDIQLFSVPKFKVSISNTETVPLKVIRDDEFYINGYFGISTITDSCCCKNVWDAFYESKYDTKLCTDKIYVSYLNIEGDVKCCIGKKSYNGQKIPQSRWACFTANTTDDDCINGLYSKIIYEWLPSANLIINKTIPTVEVFPFDMEKDGFDWEIRIPIE